MMIVFMTGTGRRFKKYRNPDTWERNNGFVNDKASKDRFGNIIYHELATVIQQFEALKKVKVHYSEPDGSWINPTKAYRSDGRITPVASKHRRYTKPNTGYKGDSLDVSNICFDVELVNIKAPRRNHALR